MVQIHDTPTDTTQEHGDLVGCRLIEALITVSVLRTVMTDADMERSL